MASSSSLHLAEYKQKSMPEYIAVQETLIKAKLAEDAYKEAKCTVEMCHKNEENAYNKLTKATKIYEMEKSKLRIAQKDLEIVGLFMDEANKKAIEAENNLEKAWNAIHKEVDYSIYIAEGFRLRDNDRKISLVTRNYNTGKDLMKKSQQQMRKAKQYLKNACFEENAMLDTINSHIAQCSRFNRNEITHFINMQRAQLKYDSNDAKLSIKAAKENLKAATHNLSNAKIAFDAMHLLVDKNNAMNTAIDNHIMYKTYMYSNLKPDRKELAKCDKWNYAHACMRDLIQAHIMMESAVEHL